MATNPAAVLAPQQPAAAPARQPKGEFDGNVRIRRARRSWAPADATKRQAIAERVVGFYRQDMEDRASESDLRLQRYAKYRMFTGGKDFPWPNSSDIGLPDLMTQVQRTEDTLVNAVMSGMPPVSAKAQNPADRQRQETVDRVLMHQLFHDQRGSRIIAELAHNFAGPDGTGTVFMPWVKETRRVVDREIIEGAAAPPASGIPADFWRVRVEQQYPSGEGNKIAPSPSGWDYRVTTAKGDELDVRFYSRAEPADDGAIVYEQITEREAETFDGPCWIVKPWEDVLKPARARNLQAPSPSNPGGAAHVILVDRNVTVDEVARLQRRGIYDLMKAEDVEALRGVGRPPDEEGHADQKAAIAGKSTSETDPPPSAESHKTVTRLTCFDTFDIDGDGIDEDVIFTVLMEPSPRLVKAAILTEMYPVDPPRRPVFSEDFLPEGVSLVELLESTHDAIKQQLDMTVDVGALTGVPWGVYRATGGLKPEVMRIEPGALVPVQDVQRDVAFPQMPNSQIGVGINLIGVLSQMQERTSMQGEMQFGRVPQGKASALRTSSGMQSIMMQGEARPERILGRFFTLLCDLHGFQHDLNRRLLKPGKVVMMVGPPKPNSEMYMTVASRADLGGRYQFDFQANVFNTSRQALQQSLGALMGVYLTPLALQLGIMRPDGAYRLMRDFGNAYGQDPDQYLAPPTPDAMLPSLSWQEALHVIMNGGTPMGRPVEPGGWQEHLQGLLEFMQTDQMGFLLPTLKVQDEATGQAVEVPTGAAAGAVDKLKMYVIYVQRRMVEEATRQRIIAAAGQQGQGGGGQGGPAGAPQSANDAQAQPMVSGGAELLDESLPGAGGGANQGGGG